MKLATCYREGGIRTERIYFSEATAEEKFERARLRVLSEIEFVERKFHLELGTESHLSPLRNNNKRQQPKLLSFIIVLSGRRDSKDGARENER